MENHIVDGRFGGDQFENILLLDEGFEFDALFLLLRLMWMNDLVQILFVDIKAARHTAESGQHLVVVDNLFVDQCRVLLQQRAVSDLVVVVFTHQVDQIVHLPQALDLS